MANSVHNDEETKVLEEKITELVRNRVKKRKYQLRMYLLVIPCFLALLPIACDVIFNFFVTDEFFVLLAYGFIFSYTEVVLKIFISPLILKRNRGVPVTAIIVLPVIIAACGQLLFPEYGFYEATHLIAFLIIRFVLRAIIVKVTITSK